VSAGVRVRRAVTGALTGLGPENGITRAVVRRTCSQRGVKCTFGTSYISLTRNGTEIRLPLVQAMFAPYVSNYFETFAASVVGTETKNGRVVDFSEPRLHHYVQLDADFELPAFPEAIDFDDEYFRHGAPEPGSLVFDLGANVGLVTHALSKAVGPTGRVVSFEPDPTSLDYLRRNNERHGLENVTVVPAAISDVNGVLEFFAEGTITSGLASTRKDAVMTKSQGSVIACDAITLGDAMERYGMPTWIKVDIEGAEISVLEQARELLSKTRPFLVIDTSHVVGSDTTAARVESMLQSAGYATETRFPGGSQLTWAQHGGFTR
jgi:FkbM family methyltransferase